MFERALNGVAPLIVAGRWHRFEQQIHRCILQRARRIALPVADDHSARGIWRFRGDAGQL